MSCLINPYRFAAAGGGAGVSTQWRILIYTSLSGHDSLSVTDIQFRGSIGGPNLATGGTPIADSSNGTNGGTLAGAFDGNSATYWQSSVYNNGWLGYTFPSAVTINQVALTVTSGLAPGGPSWFDVQYYDGSTWVTWFTGYTASWSTATQTFSGAGLGPERTTDSGFDNPASWTTSGGWSISGSNAVGTSASNSLSQAGVFVVGHSYAITFDYNMTSGSALRILGSSTYITRPLASSGTVRATVLANSTTFTLQASTAVFTGTIPSISVKEIL
jgi:hypothetical protein